MNYKKYEVKVDSYDCHRWYMHGRLHREDGPAIHSRYYEQWYIEGKRHREDGPAVDWGYYKEWYRNGKLHREDGPAVESANGENKWFVDGKELTEQEFIARQQSHNGDIVEIDGMKYKLVLI